MLVGVKKTEQIGLSFSGLFPQKTRNCIWELSARFVGTGRRVLHFSTRLNQNGRVFQRFLDRFPNTLVQKAFVDYGVSFAAFHTSVLKLAMGRIANIS